MDLKKTVISQAAYRDFFLSKLPPSSHIAGTKNLENGDIEVTYEVYREGVAFVFHRPCSNSNKGVADLIYDAGELIHMKAERVYWLRVPTQAEALLVPSGCCQFVGEKITADNFRSLPNKA